MEFTEWYKKITHMTAIADRIHDMRLRRLKQMCKAAGLDPTMLGIHLHNAMVSYNQGHPWPEVDYTICKKVDYLEKSGWLWEAYEIVHRWDARVRGYPVS